MTAAWLVWLGVAALLVWRLAGGGRRGVIDDQRELDYRRRAWKGELGDQERLKQVVYVRGNRALNLLFALALCAVAIVALFAFAGRARSAPVPRNQPPLPLTSERLVGTWVFAWGTSMTGEIAFSPEGTYVAHLGHAWYAGDWSVTGDKVTLLETCLFESGIPVPEPARVYDFTLKAGDKPGVWRGETTAPGASVAVKLTRGSG